MRKLILSYCTRCGHAVTPYQSQLAHDAPYDPYSAEELGVLATEDVYPVRYNCPQCDERWPAHMAGFELTGILCLDCQEVMDVRADHCGLCGIALQHKLASIGRYPARHISSRTLWRKLEWVVHEVHSGAIFFIDQGQRGAFVLLPEILGSRVMGLCDPEYGWPHREDLASITSLDAIRPSNRRHPFITFSKDGAPPIVLAVAVSPYEFHLIKASYERRAGRKPLASEGPSGH